MGIGSSKSAQQKQAEPSVSPYYSVERTKSTKRSRHHSAQGAPTTPTTRIHYDAYTNTDTSRPLVRSQSTKNPRVTERRDKRAQRAYATEDGQSSYLNPAFSQQQHVSHLRNPLPAPPKDILAPSPEFDERTFEPPLAKSLPHPQMTGYLRSGYTNPPPFIPVSEEEVRRRRKASMKDKGRGYGYDVGQITPVHPVDPSSSLSSHSSVSTTRPPGQVVSPGFGMLQDIGSPQEDGKKGRRRKFLSGLMPSFSSSPPPEESSLSNLRSARKSHDGAHTPFISQPHMLAPRVVSPPRPPIAFYFPEEDYSGFTTFSPHKILYKKKLYHTAEHLYQAMKFLPERGSLEGDAEAAEHIRVYSANPSDAVMIGRQLNKKAKSNWKAMRTVWMDQIMYLKFTQHPELRNELIGTHGAELVHVSPVDPYWGVGHDGSGRNELGQVLVRVRNRIIRELEQ